MKKIFLVFFSVFFLISCSFSWDKKHFEENPEIKEKKTNAEQVARAWLETIDAWEYWASWEQSASILQQAITKSEWEKSIGWIRGIYGKRIKRELFSSLYKTELPWAPDGEYVIFQYKTSFENKKNTIETVTPLLEDGEWKVSGYYIK